MWYDTYDIEYFEKQNENSLIFINSLELIEINVKDIVIGDKIVINYYPDSQKHIYDLYTKYGLVTDYIVNDSEDELSFFKLRNENTSYNASHGCIGLYSRGYWFNIYKIK
jgi:hypothetical protein